MKRSLQLAWRWFAATTIAGLLSACYSLAGLDMSVEGRHKMWVAKMQTLVGRANMFDCSYWICTQRSEDGVFLGDAILANGNKESGYSHWRGKCLLFFEYDPKTGVIVGFRFEESERFACRISGA